MHCSLLLLLLPLFAFTADIAIYGGTSAAVVAAVQAARLGRSVILVSPEKHLGGMMSNGLGWVDSGNPSSIGGISSEFFRRVKTYYNQDRVWKWEPKREIKGQFVVGPPEGTMWVFEPHVAELLFEELLDEWEIEIVRGERLLRNGGVLKEGLRIAEIILESGRKVEAKVFIDATYEGDLMATAGISYTVGRESNSLYNETRNGIFPNTRRGNIPRRVDGFLIKGNPESGLLPRIFSSCGGKDGDEDRGIQAYNYRICLTDVPENRIYIEKPEHYDERNYELVFRAIQAGVSRASFLKLDLLPNRKTDSNNHGPVSTDFVGMNWGYPEADYETREKIALAHEQWIRGLIWTLQNHPRVHHKVRDYYAFWGLPKDEFVDNGHFPRQLYIREARRMISDLVISENTALGKTRDFDAIGLASYHLDSHAVKYFVAPDGFLMTEGAVCCPLREPFSISYRAIVPKRGECENLLVPVCLSASHIAYSSVRMEPVYMVLGQSAATAASLAIRNQIPVQDVPYDQLREQLLADGQIIEWPPPKK